MLTSVIVFLVGAVGTAIILWFRSKLSDSAQVNTEASERITQQEAQAKLDREARLKSVQNEADNATTPDAALALLRSQLARSGTSTGG